MGGSDDARVAANKAHWDDRAAVHARSRYYALDEIVAEGPRPIAGPDEAELGPIAGCRLLHLHCHIGTDTLRWAALGAEVTGVDLSGASLAVARSLAGRLGLPARFLECAVEDLPGVLEERFDVDPHARRRRHGLRRSGPAHRLPPRAPTVGPSRPDGRCPEPSPRPAGLSGTLLPQGDQAGRLTL